MDPQDSTTEIWKPIVGYEGLYEISNQGRVRQAKFLAGFHDGDGYYIVKLHREGSVRTRRVHHLVLETFIGPRADGTECRHLNGVAGDNRPENLCWGTPQDNAEDKKRHGTNPIGERNARAKLTEIQVREIRQLRAHGWKLQELVRKFGVSEATVSMVCTRQSWKHVK